ncbi:MAG TPA: sigma-54 dependent transcriptional regulator [Blastocatellia bacterium]|nr:sigma-54 dependent transcriptional regulator [Blastocatellia bacterium]
MAERRTKDKVLVIDDEPMIRYTLSEALRGWGYGVSEAGTVAAGLAAFDAEQPDIVLLDINLPDGSGIDALRQIKQRDTDAVVIMITADVIIENTIAALRGGAYDFIGKPVTLDELEVTIRNGIEAQALRKEVRGYRRERARQFSFGQIVGESPALREMIELARKVADSEVSSVLLQGESGTGKDLVAKAIHYGSRRATAPFVAINCAAIPANLIESELFGYEKGAFTDAKARKEGLFEQAEGGTLFLDEIGELELSLQAKLLRVLEEGTFRRVGGLKDIPLDVRVVVASNRDLKAESAASRFRLDLYYRLSVIQIDIPPLRERGNDVILLAEHYIRYFNERLRKRVRGLTPAVAEIFRRYSWPGNVRELRNVIERVIILEDGEMITPRYLPRGVAHDEAERAAPPPSAEVQAPPHAKGPVHIFTLPPEGVVLDDLEMSLVQQALERSQGNQTRAAELLSISRDQLRYRLKKLESAGQEATAPPTE